MSSTSVSSEDSNGSDSDYFRNDAISDSEPLAPNDYWIITDTCKKDWEQEEVPIVATPSTSKVKKLDKPIPDDFQEFKLPKDKYIHLNRDAQYQPDLHELSTVLSQVENTCSYDIDTLDAAWLHIVNAERACAGRSSLSDDNFEIVMEKLELWSCSIMNDVLFTKEECVTYTQDICDICQSPFSNEDDIFLSCISCKIIVHQGCYGVTDVPAGSWFCRPCDDGVRRPCCVLCPNRGGAMKRTTSRHKWAHVTCALWIPEVQFRCAEKMEPITNIQDIPIYRWFNVCILCGVKEGVCIVCSVNTCTTAYHVTCAIKHGIKMRTSIEDNNSNEIIELTTYCHMHSLNPKEEQTSSSESEEQDLKKKRRKYMAIKENNLTPAVRLREILNILDMDRDAVNAIYNYWRLKRRSCNNEPLLGAKMLQFRHIKICKQTGRK